MDAKKAGHITLIETPRTRPVLEISTPPGTPLKAAPHVLARIDELILKLTGCPCISGIDIHIRDGIVNPGQLVNEQVALAD